MTFGAWLLSWLLLASILGAQSTQPSLVLQGIVNYISSSTTYSSVRPARSRSSRDTSMPSAQLIDYRAVNHDGLDINLILQEVGFKGAIASTNHVSAPRGNVCVEGPSSELRQQICVSLSSRL